jgi:hypothetical protein
MLACHNFRLVSLRGRGLQRYNIEAVYIGCSEQKRDTSADDGYGNVVILKFLDIACYHELQNGVKMHFYRYLRVQNTRSCSALAREGTGTALASTHTSMFPEQCT